MKFSSFYKILLFVYIDSLYIYLNKIFLNLFFKWSHYIILLSKKCLYLSIGYIQFLSYSNTSSFMYSFFSLSFFHIGAFFVHNFTSSLFIVGYSWFFLFVICSYYLYKYMFYNFNYIFIYNQFNLLFAMLNIIFYMSNV